MHPKFLSLLCCPESRQDLQLNIEIQQENGMVISGTLNTPDGRYSYPIIDGCPRFVAVEGYAASFGREWEKFPQVQFEKTNQAGPMAGHTKKMFHTMTAWSEQELCGKIVVEFGCGAGRFIDVLRRQEALVVGLEISRAADVARKNFENDPDVLIVQGDVLQPPFRKNVMDYGYSIGVFHHTPVPEKGVSNLFSCVKPGGKVCVGVYQEGKDGYGSPAVFWWRTFFNDLQRRKLGDFGLKAALFYAKVSAYFFYPLLIVVRKIPWIGRYIACFLQRYIFVVFNIPDVNWRVLDTFDAITPRYASVHSAEQVAYWFSIFGGQNVIQTPWGVTTYSATKIDV